eukprot:TRINITY_DN896_c0_g1_i1.p1 TRINITY_DN896_c0_g1~~TRINITY_DN896_c0_g1_i1.p1  ORF type:complete len:297 (-),score=126.52 TRINITY_DN896_c0_g1_i1:126-1016(-)
MGCCSSLASAAGVDAPQIDEQQTEEITNIVVTELGKYTPKFSVAFCAILCEESKKHNKHGGPPGELEMKSHDIEKHTEKAIKMADDPDFDPTTVTAKEKEDEKDEKEGLKEKVEGAVDAALAAADGDDDDDGDDDGSGTASNVTSETVRDSVVSQLVSIRADLISKMGSVPEAVSGAIVDAALNKAVEKIIFKVLVQFATLHVKEWNKLIRKKKNPKRVFKRGQKICKTIKDVKSLKDNLADFSSAVQDGNALDAAKAAKGAYDDAGDLQEDRENMKEIKKGRDEEEGNSHSGAKD